MKGQAEESIEFGKSERTVPVYQPNTETKTAPILFFFTTARTLMIQEDQLQHKSGGYSEQDRWITGCQGQGFDADTTTTASVADASRFKSRL